MPGLELRELAVRYDGEPPALRTVSFDAQPGQILAVVGPSGAGKTTLLRTIAGLIAPYAGDVLLDGRSLLGIAPRERRAPLVFQDDALFRTMSVGANLAFGLRDRKEGRARMDALVDAFDLRRHLRRRPSELSGGERQRVAIARALLSSPALLLMDEPLAHLDPQLRGRVRDEIVALRARFDGPIVYVTHDHAEAMTIGDKLVVLVNGNVEDAGEPERVYDAPRTLRAAAFLGDRPMNLFDAAVLDPNDRAIAGVRPEHVRIAADGLNGVVVRRELTGADVYLHVETAAGVLLARVPAGDAPREGARIHLAFAPRDVRRFERESGVALA